MTIPPGMWTNPEDFSEEFQTEREEELTEEEIHEHGPDRGHEAVPHGDHVATSTGSIVTGGTAMGGRNTEWSSRGRQTADRSADVDHDRVVAGRSVRERRHFARWLSDARPVGGPNGQPVVADGGVPPIHPLTPRIDGVLRG